MTNYMLNPERMTGKCCPIEIIQKQIQCQLDQEHLCRICYQVMTRPVVLNCGQKVQHVFGLDCIQQWWAKQGKNTCPLCRTTANNINQKYTVKQNLIKPVQNLKAKCNQCQWQGKVKRFAIHQYDCQKGYSKAKQIIDDIPLQCQTVVKTRIVPHLKEKHNKEINLSLVGLDWVKVDWNSQIQNQKCIQCISFMTKYVKIFIVDKQEVLAAQKLLKKCDPIWHIRDLFSQ